MSKRLSLILLCFIMVQLTLSYASERKNLYECKNERDANSCSGSCFTDKEISFQFKINKINGTVMRIAYDKGKQIDSHVFKECSIFDEQNWDCDKRSELEALTFISVNKMVNDISIGWTEFNVMENKRYKSEKQSFYCEK